MNQVLQRTEMIRAAEVCATAPPSHRYLRCDTAAQIYDAVPALKTLTLAQPDTSESPLDYFNQLRSSATPEDAVTFAAFAPKPQTAIWWGHETVRLLPALLCENDAKLMEHVGNWINAPDTQLRHWIMRRALFANRRTPAVQLGLAVGWSGGPIAPNDAHGVSRHRCPSAINTAVHATLAKTRTADRPFLRNHILDLAERLFHAY